MFASQIIVSLQNNLSSGLTPSFWLPYLLLFSGEIHGFPGAPAAKKPHAHIGMGCAAMCQITHQGEVYRLGRPNMK